MPRCHQGCKWTAENGKLYLFIGSAGIFELTAPAPGQVPQASRAQDPKPSRLEGQRLKGHGLKGVEIESDKASPEETRGSAVVVKWSMSDL